MLITALVYFVFGETLYALMFNTLKLATFLNIGISALASTALTHLVMLIIIAVVPLFVKKRK